ncbi:MAG: hypothetical protein AB7O88_05000 [Reyranellaceae bacterium]
MFTVQAEVCHHILLIRCAGVVTADELAGLVSLAREFVRQSGPRPTILDLSAICRLAAPTGLVVALAQRPPIMGDEARVYVAPAAEVFGLTRLYAAYQELAGFRPPTVARSLDEALRLLSPDDPDLRPCALAVN